MRNRGSRNNGFTMVEVLAVVAIIVILLGISMVSVARYRDLLKLTELDNAAREIYMAAENRAVLLSGARRLSSQVGETGTPATLSGHSDGAEEDLYYVSKAGMTKDLLTAGSIDPTLLDGDFYIVYDRKSGSVTDVFFAEEAMDTLIVPNFETFYAKWAQSRSERLKLKDQMLVGWYSGRAAQGADIGVELPKEPCVRVMIKNEEELTVTVEYTAPGPARLSVRLGDTGPTKSIALSGGNISVPAGTGSYTWVLDSLNGQRFKDLAGLNDGGSYIVTPGDDFCVKAVITSDDGSFPEASDSDTNNSLFQEGSKDSTAYIRYLRHLQNLDGNFSNVSNKTSAVQTADIRCKGNETYGDYDFVPIYNAKLASYDGRANEIRGLYVSGKKLNGDNAHAGLFSRTGTGTSALSEGYTFKNIRLVNAYVEASEGKYAGALVGKAGEVKLQNCWVYWEPDGDVTDLKGVLGSDASKYHYQMKGDIAGGLVGEATGNFQMTGCLAATLIEGKSVAGGLIGKLDGSKDMVITYSYADCYLTGGADSKVAGLIGQLPEGKNVALTNCYAAGYIMGGGKAAGLCLGGGTTTATNVYSAVRYRGPNIENIFSFLTENQVKDTFVNTNFLGQEKDQVSDSLKSTSYADMTSDEFVTTMGESFERKTSENSHPYNLREHLFLNIYSYPGLKNMPHYGDWGAEFKEPSLVYYEEYDDGTWGVSGGNARDLVNSLDDNKLILSDGYAVAFLQTDLVGAFDPELTCTYYNDKWELIGEKRILYEKLISTEWKNDDGSSANYYMILLPDDLVNSDYAQDSFYRYLKFELNLGDADELPNGEYFFNPHFAETVVPVVAADGTEGGWTQQTVTGYAVRLAADMDEIKIRTPRHLYDLSQFAEYYNNTRRDVYHQILDLDYSSYAGYDGKFKGEPYTQQPIGRLGEAFSGTYDGGCRLIKNVVPKVSEVAQRRYAGLFGYSTGTLRNIVYEMNPDYQVTAYLGSTADNLYVGTLTGGNAGTMYNCAVFGANLRAGASGVNLYVGGLAGQNQGTIRDCAAEFAQISANCFNYARIYIGGMVGENAASRSIETSCAVGRINAEVDNTVQTARICGFVGWNYGYISNSYAAVDLQSSGENVEAYGFCGRRAGDQTGTGYLDQGNFTYRGTAYAANYHRVQDKAESVTYTRLSGTDSENPYTVSGMAKAARSPHRTEEETELLYPYPTAVVDENKNYIHYGRWPTPMPLGEMGVFYWEKMVDAEGGGNPTYHMSALAVDPAKNRISKQSNLSTIHNDGRVVTEYGYGYYSKAGTSTQKVEFSAENIGYTEFVGNYGDNRIKHQALDPAKIHGETLSDNINGNIKTDADKKQFKDNQKEADNRSKNQEIAAQAGLAAQMPGYTFHCWNSYHEGGKAVDGSYIARAKEATSGLYLFDMTNPTNVNPNGGSFILKQAGGTKSVTVKFCVNPQFADSMSVNDAGGLTVVKDKTSGDIEEKPGSQSNPYQIRSGIQLQEINCYDTLFTDVPVGFGSYTADRFPYLSGDGYSRFYYWKQTHDLDWVAEGNTYLDDKGERQTGVFMTIAQTHANEKDPVPGWFSGSYDGQNYTMKNFNIGINTGNYEVNCMGLFGVAKGAILENIVMFSESGNDVVTIYGRGEGTGERMRWYAGGTLVGLAMKDEKGTGRIINCAAAGYTIVDKAKCTRIQQLNDSSKPKIGMEFVSGTRYVDMGGAIGGLVGMTDMDLTGCMASVTIRLENTYPAQNSSGDWNVPIRVGGLVGSTTGSVSNCYTGGTIDTSQSGCEIYAGVMTGGVGMVTADYYDRKDVSIKNCYSYMELDEGEGKAVVLKYARMNGTYGGTTKRENNYYLGDRWMKEEAGGEQAVTYRQLADEEKIEGKSIYTLLNAGQDPAPYDTVTDEIRGLAMAGRFSYAPKNRLDLQGLDYPFPTVLRQTRVTDGMIFNVHYGGWPLRGIERANGGQPVELDMFTRRQHEEILTLSEGVPDDWTWGISLRWATEDEDTDVGEFVEVAVAAGEKAGEEKLTIIGKQASDKSIIVTVTYTEPNKPDDPPDQEKQSYSRDVAVYITANVVLTPGAATLFPNDTVCVELTPRGIVPGEKDYVDLFPKGLNILAATGVSDPVMAEVIMPPEDAENAKPAIKLTRTDGEAREEQLHVIFSYTMDGYILENLEHELDISLLDLPEGRWDEEGTSWTIDFGSYKPSELTAEILDGGLEGFTTKVSSKPEEGLVVLEKSENAEGAEVELKVSLTIDGLKHELTITVPPVTGGTDSQSMKFQEPEPEEEEES